MLLRLRGDVMAVDVVGERWRTQSWTLEVEEVEELTSLIFL